MAKRTSIAVDPVEYENRLTANYLLGISAGWERAAYRLFVMSTDAWGFDKESEAKSLKAIHKILSGVAKEAHQEWKNYKKEHNLE